MQTAQRLMGKIMGDESLKSKITNYMQFAGNRILQSTDKEKANSQLEQLKAAANVLNAKISTKAGGVSVGFTMVDNTTKDTVYIKDDITSKRGNNALKFAFISKLLDKTSFGPRCDFIYNKNTQQLITLSAQLGHSKNKTFHEYNYFNTLLNPAPDVGWNEKNWSAEQKAVEHAIKAIGSIGQHLQIGDLKGGGIMTEIMA